MHDKDFDEVFKSRFDDFEVAPPSSTWNKISGELDKEPIKKRTLPPYWMAAASVAVLVSAVLWLYKPAQVVKLHPASQPSIARNIASQPDESSVNSEDQGSEQISISKGKATIAVRNKRMLAVAETKSLETRTKKIRRAPAERVAADLSENKLVIAKPEVKLPVTDQKVPQITEDNTARMANASDEKPEDYSDTENRHKIKSIGSLVNFVIARVDKRENKIIEFKDGEEGSEVSGINLGVLKFKSRNK
jgi:hypothetical protein